MKIIEEIKKEHDEIEMYFLKMENEEEKAPEIFNELAAFVLAHHESEEEIVLPELSRKKDVVEVKNNIICEHDAIRRSIQVVLDTNEEDKMWKSRCHVLKDLLSHHVEEEEGEVFKILRDELEEKELNELMKKFEDHFKKVHPNAVKRVNDKYVIEAGDELPKGKK